MIYPAIKPLKKHAGNCHITTNMSNTLCSAQISILAIYGFKSISNKNDINPVS